MTYSYEKDHFDLIVDTDAAIDDWSAILYVLNKKDQSNLLGITVAASGESHCEPAKKNLSDIVYLVEREKENIPITCGDPVPMEGFHTFPDAWRDDMDILSGISIPTNPTPHISSMHSVEWLYKTLLKNPRPVVILTLGPLTNIGQLLFKYPEIAPKIKTIYTMGGAVHVPGNLINDAFTSTFQNTTAEWNIWVDPLAAKIVFKSGVPVTLIALDATNKVQVTREYAAKLKRNIRTPGAQFYADILDKNLWFIDSNHYYFWDPLAAASMYHPICTTKNVTIDVIIKYDSKSSGLKQFNLFGPNFSYAPEQFQDFMQNRRAFEQVETGRTILIPAPQKLHKLCIDAHEELFTDDFIRVINTPLK